MNEYHYCFDAVLQNSMGTMWAFVVIVHFLIDEAYCISGLIFYHKQNRFISIFDIPFFNELQQETLKESYESERHNFQMGPIRLLFHQDPAILTSYDDDKKVTGFFGDIWTFISEYANFSLVLMQVPEKRIGIRPAVNMSYNGLLRYIEHGEADIIAKIEIFSYWSDVVDFFLPLWNDRTRLFAQISYKENVCWMLSIFSIDVWISFIVFYILFSTLSFVAEKYAIKHRIKQDSKLSYVDYIFYYYGVFTQCSLFLLDIQNTRRILNSCACLYSMMVLNFYNANILRNMVNKTPREPFDSLDTLYSHTNYFVISEKDSLIHLAYEFLNIYQDVEPEHELRNVIRSKRLTFASSRTHMYYRACTSKKNYALLESEYLKENVVRYDCSFKAYGEAYFLTWIAAGARKNFTYKRTIDRGILKVFESGLLNALKRRLIGLEKSIDHNIHEPIELQNIYVIMGLFLFGAVISILILTVEKILFCSKSSSKSQPVSINRILVEPI